MKSSGKKFEKFDLIECNLLPFEVKEKVSWPLPMNSGWL